MAQLARRERYPDLMTSVWYNQMLGAPDSAGIMVGATLPIFNVRRQNRRAEASDLRASSAASDWTAMRAMIRFELADTLRRLNTASRSLDLILKVAAPRAEQSFASSLSAFKALGGWVEKHQPLGSEHAVDALEDLTHLGRAQQDHEVAADVTAGQQEQRFHEHDIVGARQLAVVL